MFDVKEFAEIYNIKIPCAVRGISLTLDYAKEHGVTNDENIFDYIYERYGEHIKTLEYFATHTENKISSDLYFKYIEDRQKTIEFVKQYQELQSDKERYILASEKAKIVIAEKDEQRRLKEIELKIYKEKVLEKYKR